MPQDIFIKVLNDDEFELNGFGIKNISRKHFTASNGQLIIKIKYAIQQIDSISKKITSITKQKTTFKSVVDKKYIGGIKLEIGTKVFDNTISTKLETIINALKAKGDINV